MLNQAASNMVIAGSQKVADVHLWTVYYALGYFNQKSMKNTKYIHSINDV